MSENLDVVRSIYADWARGEYTSAWWADPEIEYLIADGPTPGSWKGVAGLWEGWRAWLSAWDQVRAVADEARRADWSPGRCPRKVRPLLQVRGGKVTKLVDYFDRERAFADLGLKE